MADLTITPNVVSPVEIFEQITGPCAEAIDAGEMVRYEVSTGFFTLANGSSAAEGRVIGMAINSGGEGDAITVVKRGIVHLGDALDSEDFDEQIMLSDTDGKLDDGDGSPTADYPVGRVVPAFGTVTPGYNLAIDIAI